ncbi:hypothetical protein [Mucilaginibacter sp. MD40]|nr:hypothetical protein [Mucilaginibacter sp. MD40]
MKSIVVFLLAMFAAVSGYAQYITTAKKNEYKLYDKTLFILKL